MSSLVFLLRPNSVYPLCYYWLSVLRLFNSFYGLVALSYNLHKVIEYRDYYEYEYPFWIPLVVVYPVLLGLWSLLTLNDAFILTIDFKFTDTYIGCVGAQGALSIVALAVTSTASGVMPDFLRSLGMGRVYDAPILIGLVLSFATLALSLEVRADGSRLSLIKMCSNNTKDLLIGAKELKREPLLLCGRRREKNSSKSIAETGIMPLDVRITRFFGHLLFRRVKDVESKPFALFQNLLSTLGLGVIIYRIITGLMAADTKFETRSYTSACPDPATDPQNIRDIQILAQSLYYQDYAIWAPNQNVTIGVSVSDDYTPQTACTPIRLSQNYTPDATDFNWVAGYYAFSCNYTGDLPPSRRVMPVAAYHIAIQSLRNSSLLSSDLSDIWFSNHLEFPEGVNQVPGYEGVMKSATPLYTPNWSLIPGYHIEVEMGFITRRFIKSSMFEDLIFNREPVRQDNSANTIAATSLPNTTIATATIRAKFQQRFSYLQTGDVFRTVNESWTYGEGMCDFVDDYRTNTIFDALGSIGGLFALIHAVHIFIFGKPLLWSLTGGYMLLIYYPNIPNNVNILLLEGAKLISPFGLIGRLRSEDFKVNLREHYRQSKKSNSDQLQDSKYSYEVDAATPLEQFLGDFVIDFGPASRR
ncbi:hypothetical protein B0J17DRAFT_629714 [Rhizoctonia solani]|nr:hypothetical protein B0J17DRAFT_629714 [Rhizoctonia solani]